MTGAKPAAKKLAALFGSADAVKLVPKIRRLSNGSMLVVVLGQTFHGRLASAPIDQTPQRQPANVVSGASAAADLLRRYRQQIDFPLMVPTRIERSSWIDSEMPIRVYKIDPDKEALGGAADVPRRRQPVLGRPDDRLEGRAGARRAATSSGKIGGRRYELYYNGPHLHMVVLHTDGATYWVVNTLLDRLSNETMIAIAKGLRPLAKVAKS